MLETLNIKIANIIINFGFIKYMYDAVGPNINVIYNCVV